MILGGPVNREPVTLSVAELRKLAAAYPPLTKAQQQALATIAVSGPPAEREQAVELLYKHNATRILYFVSLYAKDVEQTGTGKLDSRYSYMRRWKSYAPWCMTSDEVISACLEGFWRAVRTFDPARGSFNHHVNVSMWRAIQASRERIERQEQVVEQNPPPPEVLEIQHASVPESAKILAREAFVRYLERYCPEHKDAVLGMLAGEIPPHPEVLRTVASRLRENVPEADWLWLSEELS